MRECMLLFPSLINYQNRNAKASVIARKAPLDLDLLSLTLSPAPLPVARSLFDQLREGRTENDCLCVRVCV